MVFLIDFSTVYNNTAQVRLFYVCIHSFLGPRHNAKHVISARFTWYLNICNRDYFVNGFTSLNIATKGLKGEVNVLYFESLGIN